MKVKIKASIIFDLAQFNRIEFEDQQRSKQQAQ
jgi:hypothetical protein